MHEAAFIDEVPFSLFTGSLEQSYIVFYRAYLTYYRKYYLW